MNREQATAPTRGRGFSLLEMVLVIVVTATIAGIAIPRMTASSANARAEQAVDRIERLIEEARLWAQTRSGSAEVEIKVAEDQVRRKYDGKDQADVTMSAAPYKADITAVNFGGDNKFKIDGWGVPTVGGTITIKVGKVTKTVTIKGPLFEGRAASSNGLDLTRPSSLETLIGKMGITP